MLHSFAHQMAGRRGRSSPVCAATYRDHSGRPERVACACTPLSLIHPMRTGCLSPFLRQAAFVLMTGARPGDQSIADSGPSIFPIPLQKLDIVFIGLPCTTLVHMCCSCRSIGT